MPELEDDLAAGAMDAVGDETPARDLILGPDARRVRIADPLLADRSRLRDDEAGRGALDVIVRISGFGTRPAPLDRLRVNGAIRMRFGK